MRQYLRTTHVCSFPPPAGASTLLPCPTNSPVTHAARPSMPSRRSVANATLSCRRPQFFGPMPARPSDPAGPRAGPPPRWRHRSRPIDPASRHGRHRCQPAPPRWVNAGAVARPTSLVAPSARTAEPGRGRLRSVPHRPGSSRPRLRPCRPRPRPYRRNRAFRRCLSLYRPSPRRRPSPQRHRLRARPRHPQRRQRLRPRQRPRRSRSSPAQSWPCRPRLHRRLRG